jgi:hypothetical protein
MWRIGIVLDQPGPLPGQGHTPLDRVRGVRDPRVCRGLGPVVLAHVVSIWRIPGTSCAAGALA